MKTPPPHATNALIKVPLAGPYFAYVEWAGHQTRLNKDEQAWAAKQAMPFVKKLLEETKRKHGCALCRVAVDEDAHRTEQACLKLSGKCLGKF